MFRRFCNLREFVSNIEQEDVDEFLLSAYANRMTYKLIENLEVLHSGTVALQRDKITICDVRELLRKFRSQFPEAKDHLVLHTKIIYSPFFDSSITRFLKLIRCASYKSS